MKRVLKLVGNYINCVGTHGRNNFQLCTQGLTCSPIVAAYIKQALVTKSESGVT